MDPIRKTKSSDSASNQTRPRRSSFSKFDWLKKLGSKIGQETNKLERVSSASSVSSTESLSKSPAQRIASKIARRPSNVNPDSVPSPEPFEPDSTPEHITRRESSPRHATLADLKSHGITTKTVSFGLSIYETNPPQRIPPATPAKGNVEFLKSGEIVVRKRPRHHMNTEPPYLGKNHFQMVEAAERNANGNAKRLHLALEYSDGKHDDETPEGSVTAEYEENNKFTSGEMDVDGTSKLRRFRTNTQQEEVVPAPAEGKSHEIVTRKIPLNEKKVSPEELYTRCCHLREIMPIKNMLRQFQGQLAPIPRVRIANTKPTMVEICALSDFLTVVPVASLVADNEILESDMIKKLLSGLRRSKDLSRLSLMNTKITGLGWQYLCAFFAESAKSLMALNLSCTDPTDVPTRIPAFNRVDMDWGLLCESLKAMGSLEELDLGGTKIRLEDLKNLLENGIPNARIIGLANNDLTHAEVEYISSWVNSPDSEVMGINLSGNDLSREEDWDLIHQFVSNPQIVHLIIRDTKLSNFHASRFQSTLSSDKASNSSLRHLDLSLNPGLFPSLIDSLVEVLPKFPYLSRLQLDYCNLSSDAIVTLCEALSHCHRLVYVSFIGNGKITETAATAICVAVHFSKSICTVEADMGDWPLHIRQQLARYCLMNLEANTGVHVQNFQEEHANDENADISFFLDDLRALQTELDDTKMSPVTRSPTVVSRLGEIRHRVRTRVQKLLEKKKLTPLSVSDREALIKLFFYSNNLDRLEREATNPGSHKKSEAPAEEKIENVDENHMPPSLSRNTSQASILSLKNMEREEGESHKNYHHEPPLEDLKLHDLEKIIN